MPKKSMLPLAFIAGGAALVMSGGKKKKSSSAKRKAAPKDEERTFFNTKAKHLKVTKGCDAWLIDPMTSMDIAGKEAKPPAGSEEAYEKFLVEDVFPAVREHFRDGMDPFQATMAVISALAPTCAFRFEGRGEISDAQASLFAIMVPAVTSYLASEGMIRAGDVDLSALFEKYKDRIPKLRGGRSFENSFS